MKFLVRGGKKLSGEIDVMGAKNSVLKAMAASVLFDGVVNITNVPLIEDVFRMRELLSDIGAEVREEKRKLSISTDKLRGDTLKKSVSERLRASIVLAGPILARQGKVFFPYPGGCVIGKRPIDVFLDGWRAMGAHIKETSEGFEIKAKKLRGTDYFFRVVSVTGTETLIMTAALAEGKTVLRNAALEPEVSALADFLNRAGVKIRGAGTPTIEIDGTGGRLLKATEPFRVMPDRIEAGSFLILGAVLGKGIRINHCNPEHIMALISALHDAGVEVKIGEDWVETKKPDRFSPVNIKTREYPGFPTDLQAPFAVLLTQAQGESIIFESIFEGRLGYVEELKRMGAKIVPCDPHRVIIAGPTELQGREIETPDLRAGLAFVIAALLAKGKSVIGNVYQIDRGYERIDERLRRLGADIERVK